MDFSNKWCELSVKCESKSDISNTDIPKRAWRSTASYRTRLHQLLYYPMTQTTLLSYEAPCKPTVISPEYSLISSDHRQGPSTASTGARRPHQDNSIAVAAPTSAGALDLKAELLDAEADARDLAADVVSVVLAEAVGVDASLVEVAWGTAVDSLVLSRQSWSRHIQQ